ncbi:hypothetical protein D8674_008627 [Pyrus ussuriensis x Pyrus communis]|uniref:Uncharacterized protein n=1 Tax=Pyrus ussuriensis x Pyrus communis TaxID=2448454 RepID=A0A5N5HU88_9ROSA|nr:hypothetical protein D8674_008627 [Pyrus ussuriensis x Pyrus communis]
MLVVVHLITPTDEEKMEPYWNVMFDDVEAGRDATLKDKSKGFVSKRQFKEFLVMMDVRFRTVVEASEEERRAYMKLATELEHLRDNPVGKLFDKPLTSDKSARL